MNKNQVSVRSVSCMRKNLEFGGGVSPSPFRTNVLRWGGLSENWTGGKKLRKFNSLRMVTNTQNYRHRTQQYRSQQYPVTGELKGVAPSSPKDRKRNQYSPPCFLSLGILLKKHMRALSSTFFEASHTTTP